MNRLYTVTTDGRIFFADPNSKSFEMLETENESSPQPVIKHLSSSDWCLWSISSKFKIYLFVFKSDTPYEYQETTYENQRRYNLLSANSFTNVLLPTDRRNFSSEDGSQELKKENFTLPSESWSWKTDWNFEENISDGWQYAVNFNEPFYSKFFLTSCVRRKKWFRIREFNAYNTFIQIKSPKDNECIIDVTIGGDKIPYCEKGYLSVWIVSNSGELFFRKKISHSKVEGTEWTQIKLPEKVGGVLKCSCSATGTLALVTHEGKCLLRVDANKEFPWGKEWILIDQPAEFGIREISIGNPHIWGLDENEIVYYRAGIFENKPEGTKWIRISKDFNASSISVSSSNQVWVINSKDNILYFRDGIDSENLNGIGWKKIILKCKRIHRVFYFDDCVSLRSDKKSNYSNDENESEEIRSNPIIYENIHVEQKSDFFVDENFDIFENNLSFDSNKFLEIKEKSQLEDKKKKEIPKNELNLITENNFENVMNAMKSNKRIDSFIESIKLSEKKNTTEQTEILPPIIENLNDSKLDSNSNISVLNNNDSSSLNDTSSLLELNDDTEFTDIEFKFCDSNSFYLESNIVPSIWYEILDDTISDDKSMSNLFLKNIDWRIKLLNDLSNRNLKEHFSIDKITVPYVNDPSWSRKDEFLILDGKGKIFSCILEIVYTTLIEKNKELPKKRQKKDEKFTAELVVKITDKNNKLFKQNQIDFKDIILVSRWLTEAQGKSYPSFAIFIQNQKLPYVFLASSERKLKDWVTQISIFRSKLSSFTSLLSASTCVSMDGFAYYSYFNGFKPIMFNQIDGHFKQVEKHFSGVTIGLGNNGKLWVLPINDNKILECYNGANPQIDEIELYSYENQRWWVFSGLAAGVLGKKSGFTTIGFPTDRYTWSDDTGLIERRLENFVLPGTLYKWSKNWRVCYKTPGGVDQEGWQYAFDFRKNIYHGERNVLKDYVRRRRWVRKCEVKTPSLWKEITQSRRIKSITMDQESTNSILLNEKKILLWAVDVDGFVLSALLNETNPYTIKWRHVPSEEIFFHDISIGVDLKIWGIDTNGFVFLRYGVDQRTSYCGEYWTRIKFEELDDKDDIKFEQISAGNGTVWAVSKTNELFFRENISKLFPEGTSWVKVDNFIKYVTVNHKNEVFAITSSKALGRNRLIYRDGITSNNLKGDRWLETFNLECISMSNKGTL